MTDANLIGPELAAIREPHHTIAEPQVDYSAPLTPLGALIGGEGWIRAAAVMVFMAAVIFGPVLL